MIKRFNLVPDWHTGGGTELEESDLGDFVRLSDIQEALGPLVNSARTIDLYGASVPRLGALRKALEHLDERMGQ